MENAIVESAAPKKYTRRRKEKVVEIEKEDGTGYEKFKIKEMDGIQFVEFQKAGKAAIVVGEDGKAAPPENQNVVGAMNALLQFTLYDANGTLVPISVFEPWPMELKSELFSEAAELNGLKANATSATKKE